MTTRILSGDCRDMLKTLPDASVQCVVTSPPYYGLRSYLPDGHADKPREIGAEATPDEYAAQMVAVFREIRRVLRNDGTVWLVLGDSYNTAGTRQGNRGSTLGAERLDEHRRFYVAEWCGLKSKDLMGIPWRVAFALQADGWWLRSDIIWHKPSPMPESVTDRPTSAHEHVFLLAKSDRYFYDADAVREPISGSTLERWGGKPTRKNASPQGLNAAAVTGEATCGVNPLGRNLRNVWTMASNPYTGAHFAVFPAELAERCIKAGTSERGCCAKCGAPLVRQTEVETVRQKRERLGLSPVKASGKSLSRHQAGMSAAGTGNSHDGNCSPTVTTTGWAPSCGCDAPTMPCTVLDPFFGAGSTGLVCDRLGRDCIGIDLNPEYARMATDRITDDAPLFAQVQTS